MNKKKQKDQNTIRPVQRESIAEVRGEEDFVELLRRELEWPIPYNMQKLSDVAIPHDLQRDFGFNPAEDRIAVSRLLNLTEDQPWGVFLFEFKTQRPYLSHLRKILRVLGSQKTLLKGDPIWDREDLLFICTSDWSQFQFVHFSGAKAESAVISSFGWKGPDDPFLHTLCKHNLPRLRMPTPDADGGYNADKWRDTWKEAFNVKPVTDEFYATLKEVFDAVQAGISGLDGEERRFFAELVVNRLIFLKFVEKKGWLDDDRDYLYSKFRAYGKSDFWGDFLCYLFFEGLCQEPVNRSQKTSEILGEVPFLNAELFSPSEKWNDWEIRVNNRAFDLLFDKLLNPYNFTVCETSPLDIEVAFNQDLLGYGYEELIADQHGQGAYYTHPTEVNLMCRQSLWAYLENRCPEVSKDSIGRLLYSELDEEHSISREHALLLYKALHEVTVVDPALGSGTFPVAMMKHLFLVQTTLGEILSGYPEYESLISQGSLTDHGDAFALKLHIIERSIYGCDIDYFAVQIAKLRFWIELMVDCEQPEALPNFDCKLVVGDALVSVVGTDPKGKLVTLEDHLGHPTRSSGQGDVFYTIGKTAIENLGKLKHNYFNANRVEDRQKLSQDIKEQQQELLSDVGIELDKITVSEKHVLWQIDFAEIFSGENPGFDIAIANPPYVRHELINSIFRSSDLHITLQLLRDTYGSVYGFNAPGNSDLYVFFYIRSLALVKSYHGVLCYISSNSWLDVDYGGQLQYYITSNAEIRAIIDSKYKRSFTGADVNTSIALLVNQIHPLDTLNLMANFFLFQSDFELGGDIIDFTKPNSLVIEEHSNYRQLSIPQIRLFEESSEERSRNTKWGSRFLRAPDVYLKLLENSENRLVRLCDIAQIGTYLNTGGADEFFFLRVIHSDTQNSLIESTIENERFLLPNIHLRTLIKSPREFNKILIESYGINWCVFVCNDPIETLPDEVVRFIKWGIEHNFNERSGCKSRKPWYKLPEQAYKGSPILVGRNHHQTHIVYYNPERIVSNRFYRIEPNSNHSIKGLTVFLNSSVGWLQKELLGRTNLGQGALDTQGTDLSRILIPTLEILEKIEIETEGPFHNLMNRIALPARDEIFQKDREEIDLCVLRLLGLSKHRLDICNAIADLVESRILKARSI